MAWVLFVFSALSMRDGGSSLGALVGLGAVIVTLAVIGPWITWTIGAVLGAFARRSATLIAARRIGDDPKGADRTVSGMVLAGLIVGFLFAVIPTMESASLGEGERRGLSIDVVATRVPEVRQAVAAADPGARVAFWGWPGDGSSGGRVSTGGSAGGPG